MAAPSCKAASGVRATYTTNFGCAPSGQLEQPVMFAIARAGSPLLFDGEEPKDANTCTPSAPGSDALIGDLLVRRNPDYNGPYDLVAIVGIGGAKTKEACNVDADGSPKGVLGGVSCVVARRKFRIIEGRELSQSVLLSAKCAGVICSNGASCNPNTGLCAELEENSSKLTGGGEKTPEVEGGAPPDLDAGKDATRVDANILDAAPQFPLCAPLADVACVKPYVTVGSVAPEIVAGFQRVAWIEGTTVREYSFGSSASLPVRTYLHPTTFPATPLFVGYTYGDATGWLYAVFRPAGGSDAIHHRAFLAADWTRQNIDTGANAQVQVFASNGETLGGVWTTNPPTNGQGVPFLISAGVDYSPGDKSALTVGVRPMCDGASNGRQSQPSLYFASGEGVHAFSPSAKTITASVLPGQLKITRLVARIDDTSYYVLVGQDLYLLTASTLSMVPMPVLSQVVDATADSTHVYVIRSVPGSPQTSELFAIRRNGGFTCKVAGGDGYQTIATDGLCVYGTKKLDPTSGNYSLHVLSRALPLP